jgi:hypothetical protein
MRLSFQHSEAWDEKLVGGEGASLAADGIAMGLCRPVPARTGLGVESDRRQWAHSASCMVAMMWMSASWWYILSTPSVVNGGEALKGLVTAASVWPTSRSAGGATSLTRG